MASALDLLLSRQAAAAGVGIGTRRNQVLPAPPPTTEIPERIGRGPYKLRKAADPYDDIFSPLSETSYAARTYHDATRIYSPNLLISALIRPVKTITVQSSGGTARTLKLCFAHGATPAAGVSGDLVEISRSTAVDWLIKQTNANLSVSGLGLRRLFFCYDALWTDITFNRQGRSTELGLNGTVTYPELHGIVAGTHDLALLERDSGAIRSLSWKRRVSDTLLYLVTLTPYGVLENLHNSAVRQAGTTYETLRRFSGLSGEVKGFHCSTGFYTDTTLSTLIYSAPAGAPVHASSRPRLFRLTTAADLVYGAYRIPCDAVFNDGVSGPVQGAPLGVASGHIYRDANGVVWNITISWTWNPTPRTHSLLVYVSGRRDNIFETRVDVFTTIGSGTFADEHTWSVDHYVPAVSAATPPYYWIRSLPDGSEAIFVCESRCLVKIAFSGVGDLPSGSGIVATLTQITRMEYYDYTSTGDAPFLTQHEHKREKHNAYPNVDNTWSYLTLEIIADSVVTPISYDVRHSHQDLQETYAVGAASITQNATYDSEIAAFEYNIVATATGIVTPSVTGISANDRYALVRPEYTQALPSDPLVITYKTPSQYVYQGFLVDTGVDPLRVAIDIRNAAVHIAATNAAAGVFY